MIDDQAPISSHQTSVQPSSGNWLLWCCIVLALVWWGAMTALGLMQADAFNLAAQPVPTIISLGLLALVPGLMLLLAGFVGRQSIRSRAANALIMQAATQLLAPASTATTGISTLADATRESTRTIGDTTSEALASMKAMHEALSAERLRAESVSYAMADNARELSERLAEERKGLEVLTKAMDAQANMMRDVIPKQSAAMVAAAKAAGEEVGAADAALEARLNQLKQAGSTLAVRLTDLDAIAKDAAQRTDGLVQSITSIEDKLSQSDKTIQRAEQSSAMAVEAANSVGAALQQAVSAALDGAREANAEINTISRKLHDDAANSITQLRLAGIEAANSQPITDRSRKPLLEQAVPIAVPTEASEPNRIDERPIFTSPSEDTHANGHAAPEHTPDFPIHAEPAKLPPRTAPTATDTDLFDGSELSEAQDDFQPAPPQIHVHPSHMPDRSAGWSDIISDLDSEDSATHSVQVADMDRQEVAIGLLDRLQSSGIALPTVFRPRDKKKIAAASRKSAKARRAATRNINSEEVTRVSNRLRKDRELSALAHAFIDHEQNEALQALADTSGTTCPASPRLAAFLLTDAALTPE